MRKDQVITYQLKDAYFETVRNPDGTEARVVRGKTKTILPCVQTIIKWNHNRSDYTFEEMPLNKETKKDTSLGVHVASQDNPPTFESGVCRVFLPRDKKLYDYLEASRWNESNPDRLDTDEVIFFRVDEFKEKSKSIEDADKLVEAFGLIATSPIEELIEYAKAMNIEVTDVELILKNAKVKDKKETEEYKELILELKSLAKKSPEKFIKGFDNKLRPFTALINESIKYNQIIFDKTTYAYYWLIGQNKQLIVNVPTGILATEDWFGGWLMENMSVTNEMKAKVQTAKMMSK